MGEIKLNKGVFDAKVSELKSSASDLGKTKFNGMQLHRTNLSKLKNIVKRLKSYRKKCSNMNKYYKRILVEFSKQDKKWFSKMKSLEKI